MWLLSTVALLSSTTTAFNSFLSSLLLHRGLILQSELLLEREAVLEETERSGLGDSIVGKEAEEEGTGDGEDASTSSSTSSSGTCSTPFAGASKIANG